MERTFTQVGKEHTKGKELELGEIFSRLEWQTPPCTMGMMPGEAIKTIIKELRVPKVSHVATSHELAPYGLMGIKAHYKNGDVVIYAVDEGCNCVIIATDFYPGS